MTVAPLTGAWIETALPVPHARGGRVAPLTGAWIETIPGTCAWTATRASHPSRVRGLKLVRGSRVRPGRQVAPLTGAWIETCNNRNRCTHQ